MAKPPATTLRLILIRHAKSAWDDPTLADHDRPLNGRGRRAAKALGRWLRDAGFLPDQILCSTATRTRETCERLALPSPRCPAPLLRPRLYHASPETLLAEVRAASGRVVMVLGHNPGLAEFAQALQAQPSDDPEISRFATAATLVLDLPASNWASLSLRSGQIRAFQRPTGRRSEE